MSQKFRLSNKFLSQYEGKQPNWGFGELSYFTYKRTYSRLKEDGTQEEYFDTVKRVVEGCFSIQKKHCNEMGLPWDARKSQRSAQIMFEKIWEFKFTPPGRGFWVMGTDIIEKKGGAALNNCAFRSTQHIDKEFGEPFAWSTEMLMLGVGVGFDTRGAGKLTITKPSGKKTFIIPDTREGWAEAVQILLDSYDGKADRKEITFDPSQIRPAGSIIHTFGGTASGPEPLMEGLEAIRQLLDKADGQEITSVNITDIMNLIGKFVVAGNVRRCLPEGTRVLTDRGYKAIENVKVGDSVSTPEGFEPVTNRFVQGKQKLVRVHHQDGYLDCTPNHRIAVLKSLSNNSELLDMDYTWKKAEDLLPQDRAIFLRNIATGVITKLPDWTYNKPNHSTTCVDITIPELDEGISWLLGQLAGDGYVYPNFEKDGFNAYVSFVFNETEYHIAEKTRDQLERFGTKVTLKKRKSENSYIVHSQSKQLAWYLSRFKKANTSIRIPEEIVQSTPENRLAYLCGVLDSDGAAGNKPILVASTVYEEFAKDLVALAGSLGLETRFYKNNKCSSRPDHWQTIYCVSLITLRSQRAFRECYDLEKTLVEKSKPSNSNGFPSNWVKSTYGNKRGWNLAAKQIPIDTLERIIGKESSFCPIQITNIEVLDIEKETYDLEVQGSHCFMAENLLVHNSAEIAFSKWGDRYFMEMKDPDLFPQELANHRWLSNNSLFSNDECDFSEIRDSIAKNGEPGLLFLDNCRHYGRIKDGWLDEHNPMFDNCLGSNPCVEQLLEDGELCCLVESYPANHESAEEYIDTLKYAYLYAKSVTLVNTHSPITNSVMLRNRRIGLSQSGVQQAIKKFGTKRYFRDFCDKGYDVVKHWDKIYSRWLGIPTSIRVTSIKPSGTVSILTGATPGVHCTHAEQYFRTVRIAANSPLVQSLINANYRIEIAISDLYKLAKLREDTPELYIDMSSLNYDDPEVVCYNWMSDLSEEERQTLSAQGATLVVYFPVKETNFTKSKYDISVWEQISLVREMQNLWADNSVSVTVTFKEDEIDELITAIERNAPYLKALSFLKLSGHRYLQAPYTDCTQEEFDTYKNSLKSLDFSNVTEAKIAGSKFCDGDKCEI